MNQRAWRKALLLASGITASTAFLVPQRASNHDRGGSVLVVPQSHEHKPSKSSSKSAVRFLATSSLRSNTDHANSPKRTYQTFVDKYYAEHKCLPLPTTMHAVLSPLSPKEDDDYTTSRQKKKNILIIGDVHGCYDELQLLYETAMIENNNHDFEHVILVGDLCNKGPDSVKVIRFVQQHFPQWQTVRGNHDNAALAAALGDPERRQKSKYQWIIDLTDQDLLWLSELPYTLCIPARLLQADQDTVVVHAGLQPNVPLEEQSIQDMITLREVSTQKNDLLEPWASVWKGNMNVVFGHDAKRGFQRYERSDGWSMGLDTGACYGKQLTGVILPEKKVVRVDSLKVHCPIISNTKD